MLPALIVAIVFSVPLAAIVGAYWVKVKRLELLAGGKTLEPRLRALEAENCELRERVEVLETIATGDAPRARVRVDVAAPALDHDEVEALPSRASRKAG